MKFKTKNVQVLLLGTILFLTNYASLSAQSINPEKLEKIRQYIAEIRHPESVDMLAYIREIESINPQSYLIQIADDSSQRAGIRMKAIGLLGKFEGDPNVQTFLESRIQNTSFNESYRAIAVTSYVRGYYRLDKARVESVLRKMENDNSVSVKQNASSILRQIQIGDPHPAGKNNNQQEQKIKK